MIKMTYWQWEKLSEECQNEYIEVGMLPDVPLADLENNLILSQMVIKDGERCWEIQYERETETHIFPESKQENELGVSVRCKFVPMCGHYLSNLAEVIGYYGTKWLDFMEENHPKIFRELKKNQTLYAVAQSVNKYASDYKTLLDRQYEQAHPRPYEWEDESEHRSWTFTRNFYTDGEVMRERVLVPHRTA
jgi:hypothetical protein